jgi:hypothetical protein
MYEMAISGARVKWLLDRMRHHGAIFTESKVQVYLLPECYIVFEEPNDSGHRACPTTTVRRRVLYSYRRANLFE